MLLHGILRTVFRRFRSNPSSALIKVLGLAISIAAVFVIWAYVLKENRYDSNIKNSDRIFRLEAQWASMPPFIGHALNQNLRNEITATRLNFWTDVGVQAGDHSFNLTDLVFADSTFFKVLKLDFIRGKPEDALKLPFSIVLSESVAKRLFASTDIIGRIVRFEDQYDFTVTGVIHDYPYLHLKTDVIASIISLEKIRAPGTLLSYDGWSYPTYVSMAEGANALSAESRINELLKKFNYDQNFRLKPFNEIYYSPEVENESNTKHGNLLYNRILIAISIFILLLASVNFINLTIAGALSRSREICLKKLQGASRLNLVLQFMSETVLFILLGLVLSFFILWFFNPVLNKLTEFTINLKQYCTSGNLLILFAGFVIFTIITGIYPGLYISSYNINSLKSAGHNSGSHLGIRNALIVFQNLVSATLICCTLIAESQFRYMNKKDLGFNKNYLIILRLNSRLKGNMDIFKEKLLEYPEIKSVSYSSRIPGNYWGSWCCVNIEGKENKYFNNYVDPDYLKTLEIQIKDGRNFSAENPADIKATYLINENAVEKYGLLNPIGQVIVPGNGIKGQIIGIIKDFHYRGLNYSQTPLILFYTPEYKNYVNIRITGENIKTAIDRIRKTWDEVCPAFSFEYKFLDSIYDLQYKTERNFESLLFYFAILSLFIATIGLFGLSLFTVERRTKEIGIRKVNGAKTNEIVRMLNAEILGWVFAGFILSCLLSWFVMNRWLQHFAYRTEIGWWIFLTAGLIALVTAVVTISVQSWRAAARNPVDSLRYE